MWGHCCGCLTPQLCLDLKSCRAKTYGAPISSGSLPPEMIVSGSMRTDTKYHELVIAVVAALSIGCAGITLLLVALGFVTTMFPT